MAMTIYISSTFKDLEPYRMTVYRALRKMQKTVIAMEDYVARDDRPLDVCRTDVARSDLYVGIFAWRYGHIPRKDNPEGRSITELEYRHALDHGIPTLIFLLDDETAWPPRFFDSHTGEGDRGARIQTLRDELQEAHSLAHFTNPDNLASLVQSAVSVGEDRPGQPSQPSPEVLHSREITHPLLIAYAEREHEIVDRLVRAHPQGGIRLAPEALLFATEPADFGRLEDEIRRVEQAAVVLSPRTLDRLVERRDDSHRVLTLLQARTGHLEAFCTDTSCLDGASDLFPFDHRRDLSLPQGSRLIRLLNPPPTSARGRRIGLPYMVVAMTENEAVQLEQQPELIELAVDQRARRHFDTLRRALGDFGHHDLASHYGQTREAWQPFDTTSPATEQGLDTLLDEVVTRLEAAKRPQLRGRHLKLQLYPFDPLVREDAVLRPIYGDVAESGCVVIVDELSLCHPRIARTAVQLFGKRQVAIVTISPLDHRRLPPYQLLEQELSRSLGFAFDRFDRDLDPQCEVGVGNVRRLKRWLFRSLPVAASRLFEPEPDRGNLRRFAHELGLDDDQPLAREYYAKGGGL